MSNNISNFLKNKCTHKNRINKGTKNKPDIRCLRCDKKFTEKMYLYEGLGKFKVINIDNMVIKTEGEK